MNQDSVNQDPLDPHCDEGVPHLTDPPAVRRLLQRKGGRIRMANQPERREKEAVSIVAEERTEESEKEQVLKGLLEAALADWQKPGAKTPKSCRKCKAEFQGKRVPSFPGEIRETCPRHPGQPLEASIFM